MLEIDGRVVSMFAQDFFAHSQTGVAIWDVDWHNVFVVYRVLL